MQAPMAFAKVFCNSGSMFGLDEMALLSSSHEKNRIKKLIKNKLTNLLIKTPLKKIKYFYNYLLKK